MSDQVEILTQTASTAHDIVLVVVATTAAATTGMATSGRSKICEKAC